MAVSGPVQPAAAAIFPARLPRCSGGLPRDRFAAK